MALVTRLLLLLSSDPSVRDLGLVVACAILASTGKAVDSGHARKSNSDIHTVEMDIENISFDLLCCLRRGTGGHF